MAVTSTPIFATQKRPRLGLLSVASLLPSELDWRRGIHYVPEGCTAPDTYAICPPGGTPETTPPKPLPVIAGVSHFNPFLIAAVDGCNDPWATDEEFRERAQRVMLMAQGSMIAKELLQSGVGNPSLSSTALDVSGGEVVDWETAATTLLCAMINAGYVGDVTFHAPGWLLPSFNTSHVGDTENGTRRPWIGPHPVAFDAGYSGLIPPAVLVGADPAIQCQAGWVYATGPVEYAIGPQLEDIAVSIDTEENDRYILAERPGIVRFDSCQVFAVAVGCPCP